MGLVHPDPAAEHLRASEARLKAAGANVAKASRGRLLHYGVGFDPAGHDNRAWWARAHLNVGAYPGQRITVDGFPSGVEALEGLAHTVDAFMAAHDVQAI